MASILTLKRGTLSELSSSNLAVSELFWRTDNNSLNIGSDGSGSAVTMMTIGETTGSIDLLGDITASNVRITNDIRIGGNIYLGDALADNIQITALISSSLIPSASNFTVGSPSSYWGGVYANSIVGSISASNGVVSGSSQITHNSTTGVVANEHIDHSTIRVRGTNGLSGTGYITGSIDITLDITSGTFITGTVSVNNSLAVHSGSFLGSATTQNLTEHSSNLYYTDARVKTKLGSEGVISGSSQLTSSYDTRYETKGNGIVSGSSQLTSSYDTRYQLSGSDAGLPTGVVSGSDQVSSSFETIGRGVVSGSSQIDATSVTNFDSNVDDRLNSLIVHSGSYLGSATTQNLSEHSSNLYYTDARVKTKLGIEGVISSSDQVTQSLDLRYESKGTGIISGSSQLTSSYDTRYELSGSSVTLPTGIVSGSSQLTSSFLEINGDNVVSGSSQVSYTGLSSIPAGIVSGSSQLTSSFLEINGDNVVSGSSQLTSSYDTRYETLGSGIVSGSSQLTSSYDVRYALSGSGGTIPAGTVSGSSQLTSSFLEINGDNVISGSSQLTSSYDVRYALSGSGGTIPSGTVSGSSQITFTGISGLPTLVSGSSQLTSSYDTRYSLSGSGGTSTQILELPTIFGAGGAILADSGSGIPTAIFLVPYNCTIVGYDILTDVTSSCTVDIWKNSTLIPTSSDTIVASAPMTLTAQLKAVSTTLTGWTTSLTSGDILMLAVDTNDNATHIHCKLKVTV